MGGNARGRTRRPGGRPAGVPLGRAFLIGPGLANDPLREAVDVVARVHGDGELPTIPVVWDSSLDVRARFIMRDGLPSAIAVQPGVAGIGVSVIHEIGHVLDFCSIDRFGVFASAASPRTGRWYEATVQTRTYRALVDAIGRAAHGPLRVDRRHFSRIVALRRPDELWARCYVQYVVRRSGRPDLAKALKRERIGPVGGEDFPLHWDEDEFEAIDDAIERLFRRLGWRRR